MERIRKRFGDRIRLSDEMYAAARGADALVVLTEWQQFRQPDWKRLHDTLRTPVVIDGRNIYDPELLRRNGFIAYHIG